MNIGKFSFDSIVKMSMDTKKVLFAFKGLLLAMALSLLTSYCTNSGVCVGVGNCSLFPVLSGVVTTFILIMVMLGLCFLVKADLGKGKKLDLSKELKNSSWKILGGVLVYLITAIMFLLGFAVVGFCGKIPVVGPYLMALLSIPMVALLAFYIMFLAISGRFIFVILAEDPKTKIFELIKTTIQVTKSNLKKILFNSVLAILPLFTLVLGLGLILAAAYMLYVVFCWYMPGLTAVLRFSMQPPNNIISFLISLGVTVIGSYAFAQVLVMKVVLLYSIYLDAEK